MSAHEHLSPQQFRWDEVIQRHPEYGDVEKDIPTTARALSYASADDPHAEDSGPDDPWSMRYHYEDIDPHSVQVHETSKERTEYQRKAYQSGAKVLPPVLVRRDAKYHVLDGNHRLLAARGIQPHIRALVTGPEVSQR